MAAKTDAEAPRFMVAGETARLYVGQLSEDFVHPDRIADAYFRLASVISKLGEAAQRFDFCLGSSYLIETGAARASGELLSEALGQDDIPEGVRSIYRDFYGDDIFAQSKSSSL